MSHPHADCCPRCQGFVVEDMLFRWIGVEQFPCAGAAVLDVCEDI
jgi:hypothetical protein